jgi:hypothetical protein
MAGVPTNFQALSNVLPTYQFIDIAAGTGFIIFYAGNTVDLNLLSNFAYYSDTIRSTNTVGSIGDTLLYDVDYDIYLNKPLDIVGIGIVNLGLYAEPNAQAYAIIKLRKWTGAVETDIISNTTTQSGGYFTTATDLIIPLTHFKKGETMRLTIEVHGVNNTGVAKYIAYGHDPKNRTTGWDVSGAVPSQLTFQCPVRLNL